jgi:hypothetical protein
MNKVMPNKTFQPTDDSFGGFSEVVSTAAEITR